MCAGNGCFCSTGNNRSTTTTHENMHGFHKCDTEWKKPGPNKHIHMISFIQTSETDKTDLIWGGKGLEGNTKESCRVPDMFYFWVQFSQVLTLCKSIQWWTYKLFIFCMDPILQWKAQESIENNSVKRESRPLHIGHFFIHSPDPALGKEIFLQRGQFSYMVTTIESSNSLRKLKLSPSETSL